MRENDQEEKLSLKTSNKTMNKTSDRNFENWFSTFRSSINGYDYYVDFETVYRNVEKLKVEINILNSLVGSENIESEFLDIVKKYPETLNAVPILLAVRDYKMYCQDDDCSVIYNFKKRNQSAEQYQYFMRKTGLFGLMQNHIISNLYDYVTGIEVGLSSHGRKNRGGDQMENLVEQFIKRTNVQYFSEMYLEEIEEKWNVDLSSISDDGTSTKRWDFVVKTDSTIFVIETNFYSIGGSKLNETARSYKQIAEEAKNIHGFKFVWVTDGGGWKSSRRNLEETFNSLPTLYNINDLESGILNTLFFS